MTSAGGTNGSGTIFKITTAGDFTVLRSIASATDGANPEGNLVEGTDGNFYGMTSSSARIFKITPTGTFASLHTFSGNDGSLPLGSLLLASDGNFYGTANNGGINTGGTIFKMTSAGVYTVLRSLTSATDGSAPKGNLLQGTDGNLYGMTSAGGTNKAGTLFKITTGGTFTVLRNFDLPTDGGTPFGSLIRIVNNLIANPQSVTTTEDVSKKITLTGSGGAPLVFTVSTKPKHGNVTGAGAIKTYKPKANYNGKDSFYFIVSVGCLSSAPAKVNITLTPVNDTPVLAPIGNKTIVKGTLLTFTAVATDPESSQTRTFSLIGAPAGATINATSGVFTWTPANAGSFPFKVRVTDNGSPILFDEEQITVTVTNSSPGSDLNASISNVENAGVRIYPNPVRDKIIVTFNGPVDQVTTLIIDRKGAIVHTNKYRAVEKNNLEINVSQLEAGIYVLQVQTERSVHTFKFIKM